VLIYHGDKEEFLIKMENDSLAYEIEKNIKEKMNRTTTITEFRSWENSLIYMYKVLNDYEIPLNAGVAIEYNIPQTSKRVDFLISGFDKNRNSHVVIIELKQWERLNAIESKDGLVETYVGNAVRQVVHPSYQAWSYAQLIKDYNEEVQQENIQLQPCAYLHNYWRENPDPIDAENYKEYYMEVPAFTRGQNKELRKFIKQFITYGDDKEIIYRIDGARIRPSKSLQNTIGSMIEGNQEFYLLDEQKVVYEEILSQARQSQKDNVKRVIIIEGGPGTGKSVVAINALAKLTQDDQFVQYVSKNSAPREVYSQKLKGDMKKSSIDNMFKGSGSYTTVPNNAIDTLLIDEAHRLNEKSGLFGNLGENQIKELINACKCAVFFIDEDQRVTIKDIGSIVEIEKWAKKLGAEITNMELTSQFRCDGSEGYLAWIDNTLRIRETANYYLDDLDYDFRVIDSPQELRELIESKNTDGKIARMVAGYCWNWNSAEKNNTDYHDIVIDDFSMSWNLGNSTFAMDTSSINEIGCIHTTQGLEFDYVGVIIGNDMRYENGELITDFFERANTDQSIKGLKGMYRKNAEKAKKIGEKIIKNTYRTLMTRGMKGCYIYCTNPGLQQYFKEASYYGKE
jgi:DUF2075 family protein